jgi:hypothetical protein
MKPLRILSRRSEDATGFRPRPILTVEEAVEEYLDHLCAPLVGKIAYAERRQMRSRLRSEVEALIDGYEELGSSREEAVVSALQHHLRGLTGSEMHDAAGNTGKAASRRPWPGWTALASFGAASIVAGLTLHGTGSAVNYSTFAWLQSVVWLWLPLSAGALIGLRGAERPVKSTLIALGALAVPTLAFYLWWASLQTFTSPLEAGRGFAHAHLIAWSLFGSAGAALGSRARRLFPQMKSLVGKRMRAR